MPDFENAAPVQDNWYPGLDTPRTNYVKEDDFFEDEKKEEEVSLFDEGYGNEDEEEDKKKKIGAEQESNSNEFIPYDLEEEWGIFDSLSQEQIEELNQKGAWVVSSQDNDNPVIDVDGDGIPGETVGLTPEEQEQASKIVPYEQTYLLKNLPEGKYVTEQDIQKIHKDYLAIKQDKSLSENEDKRKAYANATRKAALDDLIKNAPTYDAVALQKEQFAKGDRANSYKVYRKNDSNKLVETTIGSRTLNEALKQRMDKNQQTIGKIKKGRDQSKHTVNSGAQQFISGEAEQMSKGTLIMTASAAFLLIGFLKEKGLAKANEVLKEDAIKGIQLKDGMTIEQAIKEVMDDLKNHPELLKKPEHDSGREDLEDDSLLEEENKEKQKEEPEEDIINFLEENDKEENNKEESNDELENTDIENEISSEEEQNLLDELADSLNDSAAPTQELGDIGEPELEEEITTDIGLG